jgi:hypothetical protein
MRSARLTVTDADSMSSGAPALTDVPPDLLFAQDWDVSTVSVLGGDGPCGAEAAVGVHLSGMMPDGRESSQDAVLHLDTASGLALALAKCVEQAHRQVPD